MIKIITKIINSIITKVIITSIFLYISLAFIAYGWFDSTGSLVKIGYLILLVSALFFASIKFKKIYKFAFTSIPVVFIISTMIIASYNKIYKEFSKENWSMYPFIRYHLVELLNDKYGIVGKSENFIIDLLGEPKEKFSSFEYPKENNYIVYKYFVGKEQINMYLNIIFKNGISVKYYGNSGL